MKNKYKIISSVTLLLFLLSVALNELPTQAQVSNGFEDETILNINDGVTALTFGITSGPADIDPQVAWDKNSFAVIDQVVEGLFAYNLSDPKMGIIPNLALDYGVWSGSNYTVDLKPNIYFHDGTLFDASTVKFTFDRLNYFIENDITSAAELYKYYDIQASEVRNIINFVEIINDNTIRFVLSQKVATFEALLCFEGSYIVSPSSTPATEMIDVSTGTLVGTGPFVYENYEDNIEVNFHAFENYWKGAPNITDLKFSIIVDPQARNNALLSGGVDIITDPLDSMFDIFRNNENITLESIEGSTINFLGMNDNWINTTFRKAISYVINYTHLIHELLDGEGVRMKSPFPKNMMFANWSYNVADHNITKAREIMQSMGFGVGWDTSFGGLNEADWQSATFATFNYSYNIGNSFKEDLGVLLTYTLDQIGIDVIVQGMTWMDLVFRLLELEGYHRDMLQLYWMSFVPDYNDPHSILNFFFTNRSSSEYSILFNDFTVQTWIEEALVETDASQRNDLYNKIQKRLVEELYPWAYGYVPLEYVAYNKEISGFQWNSMEKVSFYEVIGMYSDIPSPPTTNDPIYIDGDSTGIGAQNWTWAANQNWCSGSGTFGDPYIIQDLIIDCGGIGNGIEIRNSDVYFIVKGCTIFNCGEETGPNDAGIKLIQVRNGKIIENNCSNNRNTGIYLENSNSTTISGNIINNNRHPIYGNVGEGIRLQYCNNVSILDNLIMQNKAEGITVHNSNNNRIVRNTIINNSYSGIRINGHLSYNNFVSENYIDNNMYGLSMQNSCYNNTITENQIDGLELYSSNYNTISNNNFSRSIRLNSGKFNIISGNVFNGEYSNLNLDGCINNSIIGNTFNSSKIAGVQIYPGFETGNYNNTFSNNLFFKTGFAIDYSIEEASTTIIDTSNLVNGKPVYFYVNKNDLGESDFANAGQIIVYNCNNSLIKGTSISNTQNGIYLKYCSNLTLYQNSISDNFFGIILISANHINVSENFFSNNEYGLVMQNDCSNNSALNNVFDSDLIAIGISGAGNTISGNIMTKTGLYMFGYSIEETSNNIIDTSNKVNDKPVYFYSNENYLGSADFLNAGQILLVNCSNSIIRDVNVSNTSLGILMLFCNNNTIESCDASMNPGIGIWLQYSNNNTISECDLSHNGYYGISSRDGSGNEIIANNISYNGYYGIDLYTGFDNVISGNTIEGNAIYGIGGYGNNNCSIFNNYISNNSVGIDIMNWGGCEIYENIITNNLEYGILIEWDFAQNNIIYSNNFTSNSINALDNGNNNQWDNGVIGNYWDDYLGVDANDDGIGDSPYIIQGEASSVDNFPIWDDGPTVDDVEPSIVINYYDEYALFGTGAIFIEAFITDNYQLELPITIEFYYPNGTLISSYDMILNISDSSDTFFYYWSVDSLPVFNDYYFIIYAYDTSNNLGVASESFNIVIEIPTPDYWILSPFVIDDDGYGDYTWAETANQEWCSGSGTWNDPYVIRNVIINCNSTEYGINIRNSDIYFRIENCTIYNAGEDYYYGDGIRLEYVKNGLLINNNCSFNTNSGISLMTSSNNSIFNNLIIGNGQMGITSFNSNYTRYIGNVLKDNAFIALYIQGRFNIFSNNLMYGTGIAIFPDSMEYYRTEDIDTSNLLDNKPVYFYSNEVGLSSDDFINAGQILLYNCNDSLISNLDLTNATIGIYMVSCHNNIIQNNLISDGIVGVYLVQSNYIVMNKNNITNQYNGGIYLDRSNFTSIIDNNIENNTYSGITIHGSSDGVISENIIAFNMEGISLQSSTNYLIYLNSFIQNDYHASDYESNNNWDNGTIGNYWDDYSGVDYNDDGIGDTPYYIDEWSEIVDNYPIWDDGPGAPDSNPPTTSIIVEGILGDNDWFISEVLITLTATDDISGVSITEYSNDSINWITYTGPFTISTEGSSTIYYRSVDNAGNVEDYLVEEFNIDLSEPITSLILDGNLGNNGWYVSDVTFALIAVDAVSGVYKTEFSFDGVHWSEFIDGINWSAYIGPYPINKEGDITIYYRSIDYAGNMEVINTETIHIDPTPPTTSFQVDGVLGDNDWFVSEVLITLTATDDISGVSIIEYSNDSINWITYAGPFTISIEGSSTIYYRSKDTAGNVEVTNQTVISIDKVNPNSSINVEGIMGNDNWYTSNITISISSEDLISGIDLIQYSYDEVNWLTYNQPITISSESLTTINIRAIDVAGNIEAYQTFSYKLDTIEPSTLIDLDGIEGLNNWFTSDVTISFEVIETGSGFSYTEYTYDGIVWNLYTTPFIEDVEGITEIIYRSVDVAGNVENITTILFKIDKSNPITTAELFGSSGLNDWYISDVSVVLNLFDGTSGVLMTRYSLDSIDWYVYSEPFNITIEGEITLYYQSMDEAGNWEDIKTTSLKIDKSAPITSIISLSGVLGSNDWYVSNVYATISAIDDNSGVDFTEYSFDGIIWYTYSSPVGVFEEGLIEIYFKSTDLAGNEEIAKTQIIQIDKIAPLTTVNIEGNLVYEDWYDSNALITLSAEDILSGVSTTQYSFNGINWLSYTEPFNTPNMGEITLYYRSTDLAGNTETTKSITIKTIGFPILIDDFGHGDYTWAEAADEEWCTGSGTLSDPYIIENFVFPDFDGYIIEVRNSDVYFIIRNCVSSGFDYGIYLENVNNSIIYNNDLHGVYMYDCSNCVIEYNSITLNEIYLSYSQNNIIKGNYLSEVNTEPILLTESSYNEIIDNSIIGYGGGEGIRSEGTCDFNIFSNNIISNCGIAFFMEGFCSFNTISNNNFSNNFEAGIYLDACNDNIISNNIINNNRDAWYSSNPKAGIVLYDCHRNTIIANEITNNELHGIHILTSNNPNSLDHVIINNTISDNFQDGILIENGKNILIKGNIIEVNAQYPWNGIHIDFCDNIHISDNNINNFDNGIFVLRSQNILLLNNYFNNNAHGIGIADSYNNLVKENEFINSGEAIGLYSSNYNQIINNVVNSSSVCCTFDYAHFNLFSGNIILNTNGNSFEIYDGYNNTINNNSFIENDGIGIYLNSCYNSTIMGNEIINNTIGIYLEWCDNNLLSENVLINNGVNAIEDALNNYWDNGIIGNYWDDYPGMDADDDGIGDTPYIIPGTANSTDNFPIWDDGLDAKTPAEIIEDVITMLQELEVPSEAQSDINKAIYDLNRAIVKFEKGKFYDAFYKIQYALEHLMCAETNGADVQEPIDILVSLVQGFAEDGIEDAITMVGADNYYLLKSLEKYDIALLKLSDGKYDKAVKYFRLAFKNAMKARVKWVPESFLDDLMDRIADIQELKAGDISSCAWNSLDDAESKIIGAINKANNSAFALSFYKLGDAICFLLEAEDYGVNTTLVIDAIMSNIRDMVYLKVSDAESVLVGGDSGLIETAWTKYDNAQTAWDNENYFTAIDRYLLALEKAEDALLPIE